MTIKGQHRRDLGSDGTEIHPNYDDSYPKLNIY